MLFKELIVQALFDDVAAAGSKSGGTLPSKSNESDLARSLVSATGLDFCDDTWHATGGVVPWFDVTWHGTDEIF